MFTFRRWQTVSRTGETDSGDPSDEPGIADQVREHPVQYLLGAALVSALAVGAAVATPFVNVALPPVPGFLTASGASLIVINLLLASLLFSRGRVGGQSSAVRLGAAYFFSATLQVPWLASFPGAFVPAPLIGAGSTPVWLWCFTHTGFSLGIIRYASAPLASPASVLRSVIFCIGASVALTLTATAGLPYLPSMMGEERRLFTGFGAYVPPVMLLLVGVSFVLVARGVTRSTRRLWLAVGLVAEAFDIWLLYHGATRYSVGWYLANCGGLTTSLVMLISALHDITVLYHRMAEANEGLTSLANLDGLTGLANRRRFDETVRAEWKRARRSGDRLSAMMVDVDFFKKFNDHYGHLQGDDCLRQVAAILRSVVRRPADFVARYGGEEFVLLLPGTDVPGAVGVANALREALRGRALPHAGSPLGVVTVSIGIGTLRPTADSGPETLLHMADSNLYLAKQGGRNTTRADSTAPEVEHVVRDVRPALAVK
jgi:diguanylate cyclase (GGDEF)-like protein